MTQFKPGDKVLIRGEVLGYFKERPTVLIRTGGLYDKVIGIEDWQISLRPDNPPLVCDECGKKWEIDAL